MPRPRASATVARTFASAWHSGAHDAAPNQALEVRRIALLLRGPGAVRQAVPKCEHDGVARQARELRPLAAAGRR
jgi:hypothetical protein